MTDTRPVQNRQYRQRGAHVSPAHCPGKKHSRTFAIILQKDHYTQLNVSLQ